MKCVQFAMIAMALAIACAVPAAVSARTATMTVPKFTISLVGLPGATSSFAYGMSPGGDITGCAAVSNHQCVAYLVTSTGTHNLGLPKNGTTSSGDAVNDAGEIAGNATVGGASVPVVAVLKSGKVTWTVLNGLGGRSVVGIAVGLNNAGTVAGYTEAGMSSVAAEWSGAAHTFHASTLPSKTTTSQLNGIDAKGNAVGDANSIGYLWPASGKLDKLAPPAKGKYSFASGVVSLTSGTKPDLVVGDSENATGNFAADSWTVPATATGKTIAPVVLPALPGTGNGQAMAANAKGWIVGSSSAHACLWINGQAHDLNSLIPANSGWSLTSASGIDTAGQIIGNGTYKGKYMAFLLTPK